jgi:hypothetical protein
MEANVEGGSAVSETHAIAIARRHSERWRKLHEFTYVDRPFRDVRRLLAGQPQCVLAGSLTAQFGGLDLNRDVRMVIGEIGIGVHSVRLPIQWEDARHPGLFPLLEATLEFVPVAAGRRPTTQIGLFGRYRPPLGHIGAVADGLAGSRIVTESVQTFLDDLAERLEHELHLVA